MGVLQTLDPGVRPLPRVSPAWATKYRPTQDQTNKMPAFNSCKPETQGVPVRTFLFVPWQVGRCTDQRPTAARSGRKKLSRAKGPKLGTPKALRESKRVRCVFSCFVPLFFRILFGAFFPLFFVRASKMSYFTASKANPPQSAVFQRLNARDIRS